RSAAGTPSSPTAPRALHLQSSSVLARAWCWPGRRFQPQRWHMGGARTPAMCRSWGWAGGEAGRSGCLAGHAARWLAGAPLRFRDHGRVSDHGTGKVAWRGPDSVIKGWSMITEPGRPHYLGYWAAALRDHGVFARQYPGIRRT